MLDKFQGILGYGGIIAIHADWPIYPPGIGWQMALKTLGNFPKGTHFYEVSDIDQCKLLINQNPEHLKDPFATQYYHSAIWHEDLIELQRRGWVDGVVEKSKYEFRLMRFEELKASLGNHLEEDEEGNIIFYFKDSNGQLKPLKRAEPQNDEDEFAELDWATIPTSVCLTQSGFEALINLANGVQLKDCVASLTSPLLKIGRFDTAVREASLLLETTIKQFHQSSLFGQQLIDFHIKEIVKNNDGFNSAAIKCYRGELRTIFSFIRNDFAHNFRVLTSEQCRLILSRISDTLHEFETVTNTYFKGDR